MRLLEVSEELGMAVETNTCARSFSLRGLQRGIRVAEKITDWLTLKPQSKRMKQIEDWARAEIKKALEEQHGR